MKTASMMGCFGITGLQTLALALLLPACGGDGGGGATDASTYDGAADAAAPADASVDDSGADPDGGGGPVYDCTKTIGPSDSAASRFDGISSGDVLCLTDGVYSGGLNVPSGVIVMAVNTGGAVFVGGDAPWSAILLMEGTGSTVHGVKFREPENESSNACQIQGSNNTLQSSSCAHGGAYKHKIPLFLGGTGHLVEDSWFFGEGRYVVQCFVGDHMTFRRNIARWDSTAPNEDTEPNATFSNYNCSYNIWENNISLDYGIPETPMLFGGDFYSPNNLGVYPTGNIYNQWLGNFAVNHAVDTTNRRGFRADATDATILPGNVVRNFFVRTNGVGFVIRPNYEFTIENCTMIDVDNGAGNINTGASAPAVDCGAGADTEHKTIDGVLTNDPLWPFANEALIKSDLCAAGERQSDWCLYPGTLREYVLGL